MDTIDISRKEEQSFQPGSQAEMDPTPKLYVICFL